MRIEDDFDVHTAAVRIGKCGDRVVLGVRVRRHPHRAHRGADQVDDRLIPGVGFLDEPVGDRRNVRCRHGSLESTPSGERRNRHGDNGDAPAGRWWSSLARNPIPAAVTPGLDQ
jgi:hypothetical protein